MRKIIIALAFITAIASCKNEPKKDTAANEVTKPASEIEMNIYRSADSMMTAFKKKDWITFARFNHPKMIKMIGGKEDFLKKLNDDMKKIPDSAIKRMEAGKVLQVVRTNTDQQCVVEQFMVMHMNGFNISSTTYLIGESLDEGRTWTFFDGSNEGVLKSTDIKPNLSPELKIPEKKQEVTK
jgi:hypothetical protein